MSLVPLFTQLVKMAKRLKKEKVSVDIINFGEEVSQRLLFLLTPCVTSSHVFYYSE